MADKKVTQLTALTAPTKDDLLLIIDDPLGSPISKKVTVGDFFGSTTQVSSNTINLASVGDTSFTANNFTVTTTNQVTFTKGLSINSGGTQSDTKIASDNQANMFYVNATTDKIGLMTNAPTEVLDINSDAFRVRTARTPASSNNTAVGWGVGTITWDANYLYVAVSSSVIKRVALSTF
jgi:hypothetical protein